MNPTQENVLQGKKKSRFFSEDFLKVGIAPPIRAWATSLLHALHQDKLWQPSQTLPNTYFTLFQERNYRIPHTELQALLTTYPHDMPETERKKQIENQTIRRIYTYTSLNNHLSLVQPFTLQCFALCSSLLTTTRTCNNPIHNFFALYRHHKKRLNTSQKYEQIVHTLQILQTFLFFPQWRGATHFITTKQQLPVFDIVIQQEQVSLSIDQWANIFTTGKCLPFTFFPTVYLCTPCQRQPFTFLFLWYVLLCTPYRTKYTGTELLEHVFGSSILDRCYRHPEIQRRTLHYFHHALHTYTQITKKDIAFSIPDLHQWYATSKNTKPIWNSLQNTEMTFL